MANDRVPLNGESSCVDLREFVHEKIVNEMQLMSSDEFDAILQETTLEQQKQKQQQQTQQSSTELSPDEAIINEMVQGLCSTKQKSTFVKIIAKYIR